MIHVVARAEASAASFLSHHPGIEEIKVQLGQRSYFTLINRIIAECSDDWACVVHDDVYLPGDFNEKLCALVQTLDSEWPDWGLAGNAGLLPVRVGYATENVVRYIADPHGGPNLAGHILPAMGVDGNVMLLNLRALRAKNVQLPLFDGFQLYDIVLAIETISAGLAVLVAPQLSCWHGSAGNQREFDKAKDSASFHAYLAARVRNRVLPTLNGAIRVPLLNAPLGSRGIDIELDCLRVAATARRARKVAIVTRTQFQRPALLDRCLETVSAFIAAAGSAAQFKSYVVTDTDCEPPPLAYDVELLRTQNREGRDSRYRLVEFAAKQIDADFFWFVDDDDWMLPNEAERLALVVNTMPARSLLFVDCEQFDERPFPGGGEGTDEVARFVSRPRHYFPGRRFFGSLSGENHSPFCGVIFSKEALALVPSRAYEAVTYYEDYMTILSTLLCDRNYLPIVCEKLLVGISVRESGQTITLKDRSGWNKSMSEVASLVVNPANCTPLLSLANRARQIGHKPVHDVEPLRREIGELRRLNDMIIGSRSWRMTKPFRFIARVARGDWSLAEAARRLLRR